MTDTIRRSVGILIFEDVEVLDFAGPFEVLSTVRPLNDSADEARLYDVHVIAETTAIVSCRNGLLVQPDFAITDHPPLDIMLIPGGRGTRREINNPAIIDWISAQHESTEITTSVCTGAFLLAKAGHLDGLTATTHWGSIDWMRETFSAVMIVDDQRWVDEGHIVSSAGVSAGIDMALHLVDRQHGRELALQTARNMEYDWQP